MTAPTTPHATGASARWLRRLLPHRNPSARLVCMPHAGGPASFYASWTDRLPEGTELIGVQYPGRHDRLAEPLMETVVEIADAVAPFLRPYADRPLFLFGHSMGSLVAYETAVRLEAGPGPGPAGLFVSGQYAPHRCAPPDEALDDATVEREARASGWTDPAVFDHPELRELVLPALLADVRASMTYHCADPVRLRAPIGAYGGRGDSEDVLAELTAWKQLTSGRAARRVFEGDHFYLRAQEAELVADIVARMSDWGQAPLGHH
ncbi:thioesterase II family protein [Streptomyces sp. bgisy022]|uniref:thioesterase II family protein n=1 Tax=Streptomyces sp. bgisy022 TaxID=3413769 RepID=UPI003D72D8B2